MISIKKAKNRKEWDFITRPKTFGHTLVPISLFLRQRNPTVREIPGTKEATENFETWSIRTQIRKKTELYQEQSKVEHENKKTEPR
jgi:hypothetical protein